MILILRKILGVANVSRSVSQEIINSISFSSLSSPLNWEVKAVSFFFTVVTISLIFTDTYPKWD